MAFVDPDEIKGGFVDPEAGPQLNALQRRMGKGKQGNTIEDIRHAVDTAGYRAGGAVTDLTGSPAAGYATNVAVEAIPAVLGGEAAKLALAPKLVAKGMDYMQSALKPPKASLKSGDAARAIKTLLDEGVNVTEGGVAKLTDKIDVLDDALTAAIANSKATLNKVDVLKPLKDVLADYRAGTMAEDNLPKIREVAKKLLDHPLLRGSNDIQVQIAQDMKRANYRELGDKAYGSGLKPMAERDALKGVTSGLREGVEKAVPEAGPINAEMGPLVNARDLAQERVLMAGNKNQFGLATLVHPKHWPAYLADRSELANSVIARALYSGSRNIPGAAGGGAGGILGMFMGSDEEPQGILSKRTEWMGDGAK